MKLIDKTERWSMGNKRFKGRKKNYIVFINYSTNQLKNENPYWWYLLEKDTFTYNSLWDGLNFKTQEECLVACEQKIDELTNTK